MCIRDRCIKVLHHPQRYGWRHIGAALVNLLNTLGDLFGGGGFQNIAPVSYTHLRAHETVLDLVCRLLLEKKKTKQNTHTKLQ